MSSKILTPVSVWSGFSIDFIPQAETVDKVEDGKYVISTFYVGGKIVLDSQVKILCTSVKTKEKPEKAVLVIPDFEKGIDFALLKALADQGYLALSVDLSGEQEGKNRYTVYPKSVEYANYQLAKDKLFSVEKDVLKTCWYEWDCTVKYVLEYLSKNLKIKDIGLIGVGKAGTVLWHVLANEKKVRFGVSILNAGWETYLNYDKFDSETPSNFTDEQVKYLAGIEAQAYAPYATCPVLVLSATNSFDFDCDRVMDTVSRVKENYYSACDFSVNYSDCVSNKAFSNLLYFANKCFDEKGKPELPEYPDIKCDIREKTLKVNVSACEKDLKSVSVYAQEQTLTRDRRSWFKFGETSSKQGVSGEFTFDFIPYEETSLVLFFAKAEYENGYTISSYIIHKKLEKDEVQRKYKTGIVCSPRAEFSESVFSPDKTQDLASFIDISGVCEIKTVVGPMGIQGISCDRGLKTFKINSKKDKPREDAILVMDVSLVKDGQFTATLLSEGANGEITEYTYVVPLLGGDLWHNLKIELNRFKSLEGRLLKSYDTVFAVKFNADQKFLINNVLFL